MAAAVLAMLQVTAAVLDLQERVAAGDEGARARVEELAELLGPATSCPVT